MVMASVANLARFPVAARRLWPWRCILVGVLLLLLPGCATLNPSGGGASSDGGAFSTSAEAGENVVRIEPLPDDPDSPVDKTISPLAKVPGGIIKALEPSNDRRWSPDMARLAHAEQEGDLVTVYNVRNCDYRAVDDYTVEYYDKTYDLTELDTAPERR